MPITTTADPKPLTADAEPVPAIDGRPAWFPRKGGRRWILGLMLAVVAGELAARLIVPQTAPEIRWYDAATQLRVELMDDRVASGLPTEVVFGGTSSAWQAFVPEVFAASTGRSAFNAGLAGAVPVVSGQWLTDEVAPRLEPETVVWGLTALDLAAGYGDDQEVAYDRAIETDRRWLARVDRAASSVSELVRSRRLLRSVGTMRGGAADERRDQIAEAVAITGPDGERLDFGPPDPNDAAVQRSRLADFAIDPVDLAALRRATGALQARGVRVVLVELPIPTRFRDVLAASAATDVSTTIRALGTDLGADVVDLRDAFADVAFVDDTHLDRPATITATRLLATSLQRLTAVPSGTCEPLGTTDPFGFEWAVDVCRNG